MGNFLSGALGTNSQYQATPNQAGNPYDPNTLKNAQANAGQIYAQQQGLGQTLQSQIAGNGPNPAQTQFQQNVGQNQANAQGLIASQRGLNPALAARLGANANAASNAQAAGQSALLQQQQQLQATQNYGNLLGQMQQGNQGQQGLYTQANANAMAANVVTAQGNQKAASGLVGGLLGGAGAALGLARGGMVPHGYAEGGGVAQGPWGSQSWSIPDQVITGTPSPSVPQSSFDPINFTPGAPPQPAGSGQPRSALARLLSRPTFGAQDPLSSGLTTFGAGLGDRIRGMPAAGSDTGGTKPSDSLFPGFAMKEAKGGRIPMNFKPGGHVPGKAKKAGDSLKNDTVPAMLSPDEVVLPRSVTTLPKDQAIQEGAKFLAAVLAKKKRKA